MGIAKKHLIRIGGTTVLHVGDAETGPESFAPYDLAERGIDVALVPYWFYSDGDGRRTLATHLRAKHAIAVHVPPNEVETVKKSLAESDPGVVVLTTPGESKTFE